MAFRDDLDRAAAAADRFAGPGEELAGVVPAEPEPGERAYLCAFVAGEERTWLVLDDEGEPVTSRDAVRRTVSITAMCELAEESAGGGELAELRERLVALRITESPSGIEEALGDSAGSPFAEAMKRGLASVEELAHDVESSYKLQLG